MEPLFYKDICHDAYLSYYRKTKTNLFDQSLPLITVVIKNQCFDNWRFRRNYQPLIDVADGPDPHQELIARELVERCYELMVSGQRKKRNPERAIQILELRLQGYTNADIAKILNITKTGVACYTKNLDMLTNPINGSKLKITKQISLSSWEKKSDQEDYKWEDGNEFYELYKHIESKEGLLVKLPAAKVNPYIK